ncbi:MAG: hypothetical protein HY923_00290 [Elusimicrobia bacterium]|nr:hypothetical protein [Elusimicrobiota bacterium]
MTRRYLPLAALLLVVAGCDFKETRSGQIVLTAGTAGIPLNGKAGAATLVAGRADITFKKGSSDKSIAIIVKQNGRADVELEAAVSKGYESGNFTLKGAEIGQPVDMTSARAYAITGGVERYTTWENQGSQECLVEISYEPCDENWTVGFKSTSGADLGSFASRTANRCNEYRRTQFCRREPNFPRGDYPRGPHGRHGDFSRLQEIGVENLKFD